MSDIFCFWNPKTSCLEVTVDDGRLESRNPKRHVIDFGRKKSQLVVSNYKFTLPFKENLDELNII